MSTAPQTTAAPETKPDADAGSEPLVLLELIQRLKVRDVMTSPVVAASPDTELRQIVRVMLARDVDGVPITTEGGRLLGFISRSDILAAVVNDPPLSVWR